MLPHAAGGQCTQIRVRSIEPARLRPLEPSPSNQTRDAFLLIPVGLKPCTQHVRSIAWVGGYVFYLSSMSVSLWAALTSVDWSFISILYLTSKLFPKKDPWETLWEREAEEQAQRERLKKQLLRKQELIIVLPHCGTTIHLSSAFWNYIFFLYFFFYRITHFVSHFR